MFFILPSLGWVKNRRIRFNCYLPLVDPSRHQEGAKVENSRKARFSLTGKDWLNFFSLVQVGGTEE